MHKDNSQDYDIIIIGAGLVGCSLVAALANTKYRIAILEKNLPASRAAVSTDARPLALNYGSYKILNTLGLWQSLAPHASPIRCVNVSEAGKFGQLEFTADELCVSALGYVVPFGRLQQALYEVADQRASIIHSETIHAMHVSPRAEITFSNADGEHTLHAKLIVVADGSRSHCRELLGVASKQHDPHEQALIGEVSLTKAHQYRAYQRFTKQGILALLPLADTKQMRLVWTLAENLAEQFNTHDEIGLLAKIQQHFRQYVGQLQAFKRLAQYPLQSIVAKQQVLERCVILGNAAHTLYPLAAQGFNLGLRDVAVLAELLAETVDLGDAQILQNYLQQRLGDQKNLMRFTNGIHDVFSLQLPLLGHLRSAGLMAVNVLPPLKKRLAWQALGMGSLTAKLQRGAPL